MIRKSLKNFLSAIAVLVLLSCNTRPAGTLAGHEGFIPVKGGRIWYRVTGGGPHPPVVMIHGGPGFPSYYLNPLRTLNNDRPVITFDLMGCGRSDRITDTSLMTIDNGVAQVAALVSALKLTEFYLYGHSCGAFLAEEYYLRHPNGIRGLVLASPFLSASLWKRDAYNIISTLPLHDAQVLRNFMENVLQDSATLSRSLAVYYDHFYERKHPLSADVDSSVKGLGLAINNYMWGKNDLYPTGSLKDYEGFKNLPQVKAPVLFVIGEFDAVSPSTARYFQSMIPGSSLAIIPGASHTTMHDNPDGDRKMIGNFLSALDKRP